MPKDNKKDDEINRKYTLKRQIKDFWRYSEGYHDQAILYFVLTLIVSLVAMAPPYLYGRIIDDLTQQRYMMIFMLLGIAAAVHVVYHVMKNFVAYKTKILAAIVRNQSKIKTFRHLFNLDYEYYEQTPIGQTFSRIETGSRSVRYFVKIIYSSTLIQFFGMIFSIVIMFTINWIIALWALIIVAIYFSHGIYTYKRMVVLENRINHASERIYAKVIDFFSHIKIVKLLNIKDKLINILDKSSKEIIDSERESRRYERSKVAISNLVLELSTVAALSYMAYLVINSGMTIGIAVMIFGFFTKSTGYASKFIDDYYQLLEYKTGMYRMSLLHDDMPKIKEPENPQQTGKFRDIKINNVSFAYPSKSEESLTKISLNIKHGERIAIIGRSGSGKSTIVKLLLRLYVPKEGNINIGDADINNIHSTELYNIIKVVPQDNELMNTTIKDNLALVADNDIADSEIISVLKKANCLEFVNKLPEKINTVVGPDGIKISGGEKQRLCIARALISKPQIIILDEATSNLDVISEKRIYSTLKNLPEDITIISITHRLSSLHLFDRIIVMDHGMIVGEGTHKSLFKNNKYYRRLYESSKKQKGKK